MISNEQFYQYLHSLGFDDAQIAEFKPNLASLSQIQMAQLQHYPFQSLSTVLSQPIELTHDVVFDKLVNERKGGYCYELNGLLAQVLQYIGFGVDTLAGYIVHDNNPATPKARTHTLLNVTAEGQDYLVDVGFGGLVPTVPLKMVLDEVQTTPHGRYQLTQFDNANVDGQNGDNPVWVLSAEVKDNWQMLYAFDLTAQNHADLQVGNWFVSTHPQSPFRKRLMASRIEENGVRHTLLNNRYRRHQLGEASVSQDIGSVDELVKVLKDTFHLNTDKLTAQQRDELAAFLESQD